MQNSWLGFRSWSIFPNSFERFSINYTELILSVRRCAEPMTQLCRLKVKCKVMGFTLEFCVCSISWESFERFSLNFTQMFLSVRCCAELISQLQVMVLIKLFPESFEWFSLHSNVPLSKTVCRTHDSAMQTQGQDQTSRSAARDLAVL